MKILQLILFISTLFFQGCFDSGKKESLNLDYTTPINWESSYGIHSHIKTFQHKIERKGDISLNRINIDSYCKNYNCKKSTDDYTFDDFINTDYAWYNEKNIGKKLSITQITDTILLDFPAKEFSYTYIDADNNKAYGKVISTIHGRYIYTMKYSSLFENKDLYNKEFEEIKASLRIKDESKDF